MIDPYWAEVGRRVEALRARIWAYRSKCAASDRKMFERMRTMGKRRRKERRGHHSKKAS